MRMQKGPSRSLFGRWERPFRGSSDGAGRSAAGGLRALGEAVGEARNAHGAVLDGGVEDPLRAEDVDGALGAGDARVEELAGGEARGGVGRQEDGDLGKFGPLGLVDRHGEGRVVRGHERGRHAAVGVEEDGAQVAVLVGEHDADVAVEDAEDVVVASDDDGTAGIVPAVLGEGFEVCAGERRPDLGLGPGVDALDALRAAALGAQRPEGLEDLPEGAARGLQVVGLRLGARDDAHVVDERGRVAREAFLEPRGGGGREALTVTGGSPEGADGGFLVPVDFDGLVHEKMKDFVRLADCFTVEEESGSTGWRAIETAKASKALPLIDEAASITPDDQPSFTKVAYTIQKYGDIIPVSNELMEDNTAGLMAYLARWFAPKVVLTENTLLLGLLKGLAAKNILPGEEVKGIKQALNKGLNTAHSRRAVLLTNQDGYSHLDELADQNGRGLLAPDPTQPDAYRFKGRPITLMDNDLLPTRTVGTSGETKGDYYPLYIGDFKSFGTLFRRKALEFASTNVGGQAWRTDTTEVRGIVRLDAQKTDGEAALLREIFLKAQA